jgi:hypothetical protein
MTPGAPIPVRVAVRPMVLSTSADTTGLPRSADVAGGISKIVVERFREGALFAAVEGEIDQPDLVLTGTIQRFQGTARVTALQVLIAILTYQELVAAQGAVELELALEQPGGQRVASYHANVEFDHWRYAGPGELGSVLASLDEALDGALADLGNQIRADRDKLTALR